MVNSGTGNTATSGVCSLTYGGATYAGTNAVATITAGAGAVSVTCTPNGGGGAAVAIGAGEAVSGSVATTNGGSVLFAGTG